MVKVTAKDLPRIAATLRPHVDTLLVATAHAQLERERVDKIERKILSDMGYPDQDPRKVYQLTDDTAKEYFRRCNAWHLSEGFADAAKGFCPAMVAESRQIEAEWALIQAAEPFFGVTNDQLLCGTKDMSGLDARRKYIDLLIGLVVNAPGGYDSPLRRTA